MKTKNFWGLVGAVAICEIAGGVGAIFVAPNITGWYSTLVKPALNPPSFLFGPVWSLLYLLMGIAVFIVWASSAKASDGQEKRIRSRAINIFVLQLILNVIWSIVFFGTQNPLLGIIDIVFLWLTIVWTIVAFWKVSRSAALLLLPYIAWVSFALYLNLSIWRLN